MNRQRVVQLVALLIVLTGPVQAARGQEPSTDSSVAGQEPTPDSSEAGQEPNAGEERREESESRPSISFADRVALNRRNRFGFSLGANEVYTSDLYGVSSQNQSATATAAYSRVFANFGRRRSRLHLQYGFGYTFYHNKSELNGTEQIGDLSYSYEVSRRTSIEISDSSSLGSNDLTSPFTPISGSPPPLNTGIASEIYFTRQRILRNVLDGRLNFKLSRKASLGIFSNYSIYRYQEQNLGNSDVAQVGIQFSYNPKKWLTLSTNYSTYLVNTTGNGHNSNVVRVHPGNFDFNLGHYWHAFASGGVDILLETGANRASGNTVRGSGHVGLSRITPKNTLSIFYRRGLSSVIGISSVMQTDAVNATFGQPLTRSIIFQLASGYSRNSSISNSVMYESIFSLAGLEFALRPDLIASLRYVYQNQRNGNPANSGILYLNRNVAAVSLQYLWPSRNR